MKKRLIEIGIGSYLGPRAEKVRVADLLDDLFSNYEDNSKSVDWAQIVDRHLRPFFGSVQAARIETTDLERYVEHRRLAGRSNGTINRELAFLRRAFYLASRKSPPQMKRVPVFPRLKEAPPRQGFFEYDEFFSLRIELPEYLRPVLTFGYYTGCRKGEILQLQWPRVDLARRVVRLEADETKNEEARTIPLMGELFDVLTLQKQIRDQHWPDCPWVFFRHGKRIKDFRKAWDDAAKRAGLWDENIGRPTKLFHDLRRTGIRNLVRAGVPERVAMAISGHKTRSVFERYNIVSERDLHEAAARLDRHVAELEKARDKDTSRTPGTFPEGVAGKEGRKLLN